MKQTKMSKEKSIVVLNNLIQINSDRIQDYETATVLTEESDLKNLFSECKKTMGFVKSLLAKEVKQIVEIMMNRNHKKSIFTTIWINWIHLKTNFTGNDKKDFLYTLEHRELIFIKN